MRSKFIGFCFWLIKKLARKPSEIFPKESPSSIEVAFVCGERTYYRFTNIGETYIQRAFAGMQLSGLLEANLSVTKVKEFAQKMRTGINNKDLVFLSLLQASLEEQISWVFDTDAVYEMAACLYFDDFENIYHYDPDYAQKKIAYWKKHGGEAFFLQKILPAVYPSILLSQKHLATYLEGLEVKKKMLATALLSNAETNAEPKSTSALADSEKRFTERLMGSRPK